MKFMVKGQKILVSISEEGTREVYISYRKVLWAFLLHEGFVFESLKEIRRKFFTMPYFGVIFPQKDLVSLTNL